MCRSISPPLFSLSSGQKKNGRKNTPSERRAASVCVCGPDGNVSSLGGCCGSCVCSWCAGSRRREWWKHRLLCGAPCARAPAAVLRVLARRPHVLCRRGRCRVPCHQQLWHWRRRRLCARLCRPRTGRRGVHRQTPCVPLRPALRRLCTQQLLRRLCSPSRVSRVCPSSLIQHIHTPTCCCCSLTTPSAALANRTYEALRAACPTLAAHPVYNTTIVPNISTLLPRASGLCVEIPAANPKHAPLAMGILGLWVAVIVVVVALAPLADRYAWHSRKTD